jgi:hypothetical protein
MPKVSNRFKINAMPQSCFSPPGKARHLFAACVGGLQDLK